MALESQKCVIESPMKIMSAVLFLACSQQNLTGFAGTSDAKRLWTAAPCAALTIPLFLAFLPTKRLKTKELNAKGAKDAKNKLF